MFANSFTLFWLYVFTDFFLKNSKNIIIKNNFLLLEIKILKYNIYIIYTYNIFKK